jgi:RNA polymerase sigma-70 factor, ECF subfamily
MPEIFVKHLEAQIPRLRRYARALARDDGRAEDLVQHALLQAWIKRPEERPGAGIMPWLIKVARDKHYDELHRAARHVEWSDAAGAATRTCVFDRIELREVAQAFARLPDKSREALSLRAVERLSYREIGAMLGLGEDAVSSRLAGARQQLRRLAGEEGRHQTKRKVAPEERQRMIERLEAVRNASEVAREFRRNPNTVWRIARQAGIELTAGYAIRGHRVGRTDLRRAPEPT